MAPLVGQLELMHPARLAAIALLPLIVYLAWRTSTMMLPWQRHISTVCRAVVFLLLVLALVRPLNHGESPQQFVVFVRDVSQSVAGDDDRPDVNTMLIQPFVNYNLPDKPGRYFTFAPIITANWEADSENRWTVPLGLGIGQIMKWGEQPVNLQASAYYNVEAPDNGADWQLRLQVQFLFPK